MANCGMEEGSRRVDLARQCAEGHYELVELKFGEHCGTPLRAAMEILGYGPVYVFSRQHARELGYETENGLLAAGRISLKVTMPPDAYLQGSLAKLEDAFNDGLSVLLRLFGMPLLMDFAFEALPEWADESNACAAMEKRSSVYRLAPGQRSLVLE